MIIDRRCLAREYLKVLLLKSIQSLKPHTDPMDELTPIPPL